MNNKNNKFFFAICFIGIGLIISLLIIFSLELAGDQIIPRNKAIMTLEKVITDLKNSSTYNFNENKNQAVEISLAPGFWEAHYLALGFIGLGIFICVFLQFVLNVVYKKNLNIKSVSIQNSNDLTQLIHSYQLTISSYRQSLGILFSLFAIFSISTVLLNWKGADKLDEIEKYGKKIIEESNHVIKQINEKAYNNEIITNLLVKAHSNILFKGELSANDTIKICNEILSLKPTNNYAFTAQFYIGIAYYQLKDYNKAIIEFNKAKLIDPNKPELYLKKGHALYNQKKYLESLEIYGEGLIINPNFSEILMRISYSYLRLMELAKSPNANKKLFKMFKEFIMKHKKIIDYDTQNIQLAEIIDFNILPDSSFERKYQKTNLNGYIEELIGKKTKNNESEFIQIFREKWQKYSKKALEVLPENVCRGAYNPCDTY